MQLIGDGIRISAPDVRQSILQRDASLIRQLARRQALDGADALCLNLGPLLRDGAEIARWVTQTAQQGADLPVVIETSNPQAVEGALCAADQPATVNGICAVPDRLEPFASLAARYGAHLVAMPLDRNGVPREAAARVALLTEILLPAAAAAGVPEERLIVDPMVVSIAGGQSYSPEAVETVRLVKQRHEGLRTMANLDHAVDNVPEGWRRPLRGVYLALLMGTGLDAVVGSLSDGMIRHLARVLRERAPTTPDETFLLTLYNAARTGDVSRVARPEGGAPALQMTWLALQVALNSVSWQNILDDSASSRDDPIDDA